MGFHPFSDGLPYAPESKARTPSTGTGAVAAGRPRFQTQTLSSPRSGMKTARQMQSQQANAPVSLAAAPQIPMPAPAAPVRVRPAQERTAGTAPAARPVVAGAVTIEEEAPAPVRQRFFAYLLDTVIHSGFWMGTNFAALTFFDFHLDSGIVEENAGQFIAFFVVSQWVFIALQEVLFGNSIGKSFFNLEFKRNHSSLFLRSTVFMLGVLAGGLGLYYRPQDKLGVIQLRQDPQS